MNSSRPPSASVWCISLSCSRATKGRQPQMHTTGTCSLYAPAIPLIALRAPTPFVTTTAPKPLIRA